MQSLIRWTEKLSNAAAAVSAVLLALMTILILLEVFLWNFFQKTTLIADEYSAYGLAAIVFLGGGYCLKEKGHIRITLMLVFLPEKVSRVIAFIASSVTTAFMGYLWWYLYLMTASAYRYGSTSGTLTHTPLWVPMGAMLLGAGAFLIQFLGIALKTFQAIGTGEEVI